MGLPTGQERVLARIAGKLSETDPPLAALFAIFTRLTRAESMPWVEQVKARPVIYRLARFTSAWRRLARHRAARMRALVLLPAVTAMACALAIAFSFSSGQRTAHGGRSPAARVLLVKHQICRLGLVRVPVLAC
jgi:hypothetical protein